jgi:hypothetical protein
MCPAYSKYEVHFLNVVGRTSLKSRPGSINRSRQTTGWQLVAEEIQPNIKIPNVALKG